jgi:hydroxymethylpyrimidine pyrophosphatase-like HAD family hydrolase
MRSAIVFDIDNTLTPPREALDREMAERLGALGRPFALAAGSDLGLLMSQFFEPLHAYGYRGEFDAFVCNGASRYRCRSASELSVTPVDEFSLAQHLGPERFAILWRLLEEIWSDRRFTLPSNVRVVGPRIIDREAMINIAPSGRERGALSAEARDSREQFVAFDERTGYRARVMPILRAALDARLPNNDLLLTLGGQTSFDLVVRGRDKSFAVRSLLAEGHDHVTYVGDALFPGGNDAAVSDYVATSWPSGDAPVEVIPVTDYRHTARLMLDWMRTT